MYSLILGGGLGNQMFQYAYARFLSLEYGIDFKYNLYEYNVSSNELEERNFSLLNFNIINKEKISSKDESIEEFLNYKNILKKNKLLIKLFPKKYSLQHLANCGLICTYSGNPYQFNKIKVHKMDGIIRGGFQSEKFFEKYSHVIKKELRISKNLNKKNNELIDKIKSSESVAIHIRRGDYLNPRYKHLNICNDEYYKNCVEYFLKKNKKYTFFVFSNNHEEIEWIKKNYTFLPKNTVFIDNNNADYEDMCLMYNCKNFIISNSTFSWWAQYLAKNENKIVLAPKGWNLECSKESKDIYQDDWILL